MEEIFKEIKGTNGKYLVSNLGNVKSLSYRRSMKDRVLKNVINNCGYYSICMPKDGKYRKLRVHYLVAETFLDYKKENGLVIDHIDNNKLNNRLDNLQLISQRENSSKDKKNKTSKYTGVHFCKRIGKFVSKIRIGEKHVVLGRFENELDASIAYNNKLKNINIGL